MRRRASPCAACPRPRSGGGIPLCRHRIPSAAARAGAAARVWAICFGLSCLYCLRLGAALPACGAECQTKVAILFLPAEAIFAEVNAYHPDIIEYAYKKRVWITSPTTLISTLTVIEMIIKNMERDKYTSVIHEELNKLGLEFARYKERWDKLARSIQTVNKDVENVSITTDKISRKFDSINRVEVGRIEDKNE